MTETLERYRITATIDFTVESDYTLRIAGMQVAPHFHIPKTIADKFLRLFAAAPELLAACKAIMDEQRPVAEVYDVAKCAIEHAQLSSKNR